jgi:mxaJ protein
MRWLAALPILALLAACQVQPKVLKVCADPNDMPFSNSHRDGFENKIAELVARDLHRRVDYYWWPQWRGYVRKTLNAGQCDLWPGVASQLEMLATTRPYYRSTYVFVTRKDRGLDISSFDDPRLRRLKIGVQMIGNDSTNTPPTFALARRGITRNVRGFMVYGDYNKPDPQAPIVKAVEDGDVDVGVVWGPLAGYFASRSKVSLAIAPVHPWLDGPNMPMVFDISMGVRKSDVALKRRIDLILRREAPRIRAILDSYGVPGPPPEAQG